MTKELVKIEQYNISKNTTNLIKGVAILLMLIHHFLGFPNWLVDGVNYPDFKILGENLNVWIRYSTKICVALFAFITGYAYFIRNNQTLKYGIKKIINFLERYWFILFIIFIPIVLIIGQKEINLKIIILNLFATEADEGIINFAWYVFFYIFAMITLPLLKRISNNNFWHDLIVMVGFCVFARNLLVKADFKYDFIIDDLRTCFYWMPTVIIGWLVAKYNLLSKIHKVFKGSNKLVYLFLVFLILGARLKWHEAITINLDIIHAPLIVYFLSCLLENANNILTNILKFFSANSTNLWFIHNIFFSTYTKEVFQPFVYISSNPIIVVLWGIIICLPFSIIINYLFKLKDKVKANIVNNNV